MKQSDLIEKYSQRPQNYMFFLGAGASRNSGLPTANDLLLDLKRRHYRKEENKDISAQDMQNEAVQNTVQSFMDSRGFPGKGTENEYAEYFEKIFGEDKERQRKYISAILSESRVSLSAGNRVLGGLISEKMCRVIFTTNFDTVVEKAVAEIGGNSLASYNLEGAHNAKNALDNEEYPIYCKLHGDFRYDSIKNLPEDLEKQNQELSASLINASNRFGFIALGYSGRDDSIMQLLHSVLETENPFPHGLYWTGMKGAFVHPAVTNLLEQARKKGVDADYVEIETYDAFMSKLWRNLDGKRDEIDKKVKKFGFTKVSIDMPVEGTAAPIVRLNALPILSAPTKCLSIKFSSSKKWEDLKILKQASENALIFTMSDTVWCWGSRDIIDKAFKDDVLSIDTRDVPANVGSSGHFHVKPFLEEALCKALSKDKPLLFRSNKKSAYLIVDPHTDNIGGLDSLFNVVGKTSGEITGLFTVPRTHDERAQKVSWSEALRVSVEYKNGQLWLLLDPDIWVWPPRYRRDARDFLDRRRGDRYNKKYNQLLDAWLKIILGDHTRNSNVTVSTFREGDEFENPSFTINSRTAFSRRIN